MATPVRIVGIGSALGLDQVAWRAITALERRRYAECYAAGLVSVMPCSAPALLPLLLAGARLAVLLDALDAAGEAGEVRRIDRRRLAAAARAHSSHGLGLIEGMELLEALPGAAPEIVILGIVTGPPDAGARVAAPEEIARLALPRIEAMLADEIGRYGLSAGIAVSRQG
jgi:hydrogenase maturation protease